MLQQASCGIQMVLSQSGVEIGSAVKCMLSLLVYQPLDCTTLHSHSHVMCIRPSQKDCKCDTELRCFLSSLQLMFISHAANALVASAITRGHTECTVCFSIAISFAVSG